MTKEKFIWLLKNSVKITTEEYLDFVFYYMDPSIERKIKLNNLLNNNNSIYLDYKYVDKNNIIFKQDLKNKRLWVNYSKIWAKLESNIEYKDLNTWNMIKGWLSDDTNWRHYTPINGIETFGNWLSDDTNWRHYTPNLQT